MMISRMMVRVVTVAFALSLVAAACYEAEARAGGGRSFGSRGTRTYRPPARTVDPAPASRPQPAPAVPQTFPQQRQGGSFLRSMAGGIVGGLLGGMLFRSLGFAGPGTGGVGLFDILLIGGVLYLIYRFVASRRREAAATLGRAPDWGREEPVAPQQYRYGHPAEPVPAAGADSGLAHVRQMDGSFSEEQFRQLAQDVFFRVQGAWTRRDLSSAREVLASEMERALQNDVAELKAQGRVNRLENIAVRQVEIVEAWQEEGCDFITVRFLANLLDYTTDEEGRVVSGSDREPVKFEEFWTFTRPVGPNSWKLSAIQQA